MLARLKLGLYSGMTQYSEILPDRQSFQGFLLVQNLVFPHSAFKSGADSSLKSLNFPIESVWVGRLRFGRLVGRVNADSVSLLDVSKDKAQFLDRTRCTSP